MTEKVLRKICREPDADSVEWATPQELFDELNLEFGPFSLDPCANDWRHLCPINFTRQDNGLMQTWSGRVFMNPPYAWNVTARWVHKAYLEITTNDEVEIVVGLLPVRTDAAWFHEFIYHSAAEIRFIKGRVKYLKPDGIKGRPRIASMVVVWR